MQCQSCSSRDKEVVHETPKSTNGHSRENSFNDAQPDPKYLGRKIKMKFNVGVTLPWSLSISGTVVRYSTMIM